MNNKPFENLGANELPVNTYRKLLWALQQMNDEQLDSTITVEDSQAEECYPAELRITGTEHDSLDENHPVIYFS